MRARANVSRWCSRLLAASLSLQALGAYAQTLDERLERAKALFREGNALLAAGDPERALDRFLESRAAVPSGKNTANAAICLERLGRVDEALEMYEELLARFAPDLDAQDRENLAPIMASLRERLGTLEIAANVEGLVTIDGRPRGAVPRATGFRVMPGKRRVRLFKEGYRTFDQIVEVAPRDTLKVDAALDPLSGMGAVRVELTGGNAAQVVIDGKAVGTTPWEGTLSTGQHLLQVVGQDAGSQPETLQVLERKTLLVRASSRKLGPITRVSSFPVSARLSIDGVVLGQGSWQGRLPVGTYTLRADEPGYFSQSLRIKAADAAQPVRLVLARDPDHTRWPKANAWRVGVGLGGAFFYAPTLKGDAEAACPELCTGGVHALGGRAEGSLEVRHARFGAELGVGYLLAHQSFARAIAIDSGASRVSYALEQELVLGGPYARVSGFALLSLTQGLAFRPSVGVGVGRIGYEASTHGVAWTTGESAAAAGLGLEAIWETLPLATAGLALERAFGPLRLSLGVSAWFVPSSGPQFSGAALVVTPDCSPNDGPEVVGCAPGSDRLANERTRRPFAAVSPELFARYSF